MSKSERMMRYAAKAENGGSREKREGSGYGRSSSKGGSYSAQSRNGKGGQSSYGKPGQSDRGYLKRGSAAGKKSYVQPDSGYRGRSASAEAGGAESDRGRQGSYRQHEAGYENPNLVIGRNPVTEAIKSGRPIDKILIQKDSEGSVKVIAALARENGLQLQYVDKVVLDKMCPGKSHQGVAAYVAAHEYVDLDYILKKAELKNEPPLIILLDGLEDPHNLGAILRSADGAGVHGVVIPSRRSVSLTDTVAKASAGAIEYVPVAKVNNLAAAIDELKKKGVWVAAVDMGGVNYPDAGLSGPLAIVIGSEGDGISRLVKEKCDFVVGIPMKGRVNSLNASNAAAIIMYEAARQRAAK